MERYEAYKDSGIEWIGEIPEGWEVYRLKSFLADIPHALADGPFGSDMKSEEYQDSGVPITQLNNIREGFHKDDAFKYVSEEKAESLASHYVYPGELLMAKMMPAGRTCIVSSEYPKYLLSSDSIRIVPVDEIDRRYLCYAANAYANTEAELMSTGTTRVRINLGIVRNMRFAIPPYRLQVAIADYLDAKTAEIDALVADCEREVELLREYRKAVISEAVTKGLDPGAPMKDSGVEWIGRIPEGWAISKVKHSFINRDAARVPIEASLRNQSTGILYPYYGASGIVDYISDYIFDEELLLIGEDGANLRLRNLPLVYAASGKFWVNNHSHILQPRDGIDFWYAFYQLELVDLEDYLTGSTQPKLTAENLGLIPLAIPSLEEQRAIAVCLDAKTAEIDSLVELKQRMADKLREYRKSLISEAVTGKFKVPGVR